MNKELDVSIPKILWSIILGRVHTATIGIVQSFDKEKQTVCVQPVLMRRYEDDEEAKKLPLLNDIRVMFPGSGSWWLTFDIKKDSYVLLVVAERSLDSWMVSGGVVDPNSTRAFDLSDSIAIAGILPDSLTIGDIDSDSLVLRNLVKDVYIKLESDKISVKGVTVELEADTVVVSGDLNVGGDVVIDGTSTATDHVSKPTPVTSVSGSSHIHPVNIAGAVTEAPTPTPDP